MYWVGVCKELVGRYLEAKWADLGWVLTRSLKSLITVTVWLHKILAPDGVGQLTMEYKNKYSI